MLRLVAARAAPASRLGLRSTQRWFATEEEIKEFLESAPAPGADRLTGAPGDQRHRRVLIFRPSKNAMQSGTRGTNKWEMKWSAGERWLNPLMGWTSTSDPLTTLKLTFDSEEEAVAYAQRMELEYEVEPEHPLRTRIKSYDDNFRYEPPRDDSIWKQ